MGAQEVARVLIAHGRSRTRRLRPLPQHSGHSRPELTAPPQGPGLGLGPLQPSAGPTAGTERCAARQVRMPPKGAPAPRTSRLGVAGTGPTTPAFALLQPPAPAPPAGLHPVIWARGWGLGPPRPLSAPNPGRRLRPPPRPSPLCPHSTLLSLPSVLLKCTRREQGKGGAHPLCCYLQSRRPGGDVPPPCRHPTRRDRKEHVLGRVLAAVQPCV